MWTLAVVLLLTVLTASAYRRLNPAVLRSTRHQLTPLVDASTLLGSLLQRVDPSQARGEFFLFFFGGSGALGIGGAQIPKLLDQFKAISALKGGVTLGGEDLDVSPIALIGYPEPLKTNDILSIINKFPSIDTILSKGDKSSYMAQLGYLERVGFDRSLPTANPLARYAVYDAINGGGGELAAPQDATTKLQKWRAEGGLEAFKSDLLVATFKKYSAYAFFAFLILLVIDLVVESGTNAFL